jgi:hypothetical protein
MMTNVRVPFVVAMSLFLSSCGWNTSEFNEGKARGMIESNPVMLEGEQVVLTQQQIDCGVGAELWDGPIQVSKERVTSHLNPPGSALNFSDDISVTEIGYRQSYAQVRGKFMLQVDEIVSIRDKEQGVKIVSAKAGIKIDHACLQNPLPIMGVKRGTFTGDVPVTFQFSLLDNGWHVDGIVHQ